MPSSLPTERMYLTWIDAQTLRVNGGMDELAALEKFLSGLDLKISARENAISFIANAQTLANAAQEPAKDEFGYYRSFRRFDGIDTSRREVAWTEPKTKIVILIGSNLSLAGFAKDLEMVVRGLKQRDQKLPSLEVFEAIVGVQVTPNLGAVIAH